MVRDRIAREEAYDVPRDRFAKPTRLAWRGSFSRSVRQERQGPREDVQEVSQAQARVRPPEPARASFVPPPWRFADWSFAVLAGIAGLLTALAVFVLIGARGAPRDDAGVSSPLREAPSHTLTRAAQGETTTQETAAASAQAAEPAPTPAAKPSAESPKAAAAAVPAAQAPTAARPTQTGGERATFDTRSAEQALAAEHRRTRREAAKKRIRRN